MIPKHLRIKNFLSHDASEIDFSKFDVALILGTYDGEPDQSNGSGKSAIFESIAWALFGKSRHKKKNGVVKWDKRACEVEFEFWLDGDLYRVKRARDKTVDDSDVGFEHWVGTKFQDISCDTNTATDKKIVKTINVSYDVFVNSVYFKQNDISMFAESTPAKRKEIIKSLLRMDKWDKYQIKAKEKAKVLTIKIKEKSQYIVPIDKIKSDLEKCKSDINVLRKQIKNNNELYTKQNSNLINKKLDYQVTYNSNNVERLKALQREQSSVQKRLFGIKQLREKGDKDILHCTNQISFLQQKSNILKDKIAKAKSIDIKVYQTKMIQGRTKERLLHEQIKLLDIDINLVNECDRCKQPLTKNEITIIKRRGKKELMEAIKKHKNIKEQLIRAESGFKSKEQVIINGNKAQLDKGKLELKVSKFTTIINDCVSSNERLDVEQKRLKTRNLKREISLLQSKFAKCDENTAKSEIIDIEQKLQKTKLNGDELNVEYGSKIRTEDGLNRAEKAQIKLQKELDKLNSEYSVYDKLRSYFGRDGIQSVIIENVIEELENYANDILSKICNEPTSISIQTQRQTDSGSWTETFDISVKESSRTDDFETFSAGEQFRIALAIRLAFSNILAKRMGGVIKFLLLDEITSNLDNKGLNMFINIVKQLGNEMKILIITHNEWLKEKFEDIIVCDKGPNGSKVSFQ